MSEKERVWDKLRRVDRMLSTLSNWGDQKSAAPYIDPVLEYRSLLMRIRDSGEQTELQLQPPQERERE
jgi:hypothetical protein